jgi:methionyl-tRNA synthetase
MSKSKGNVIYADELAKRFGIDAVRYYLLSEIPFAQDGTITYESFITKFNTDLANTLGNLVNRSIAMTNKYFGGSVAKRILDNEFDNDLRDCAKNAIADYLKAMDNFKNADAAAAIMTFAKRLNKYIDETAPWVLAKDENSKERLEAVMYNLLEGIRLLGLFLCPIMPESSEKIAKFICSDEKSLEFGAVEGYTVGSAEPLFARLDTDKVLAELEAERLQKAAAAKKESEEKTAPEGVAQIGIEDFAKVELKTAKVVACEPIPKAKKLLKLTLDDGSETPRIVASGIAKWYTPDDLIGHTVIVVSNLKPAVLCGVESNGMILAADAGEDDVKVIFADGVKPGSKVR